MIIEKAVDSAKEQHNLSEEALKDVDIEEEWVEQKIDLKKLPQQYMQLSKIRLTGTVTKFVFFVLPN